MPAKKKPSRKKVETVADDSYSLLEQYCIWLNEYYTSLRKAGFPYDLALTIMMDKESYPEWAPFKNVNLKKLTDEDED
jgi:hypothetical protein